MTVYTKITCQMNSTQVSECNAAILACQQPKSPIASKSGSWNIIFPKSIIFLGEIRFLVSPFAATFWFRTDETSCKNAIVSSRNSHLILCFASALQHHATQIVCLVVNRTYSFFILRDRPSADFFLTLLQYVSHIVATTISRSHGFKLAAMSSI